METTRLSVIIPVLNEEQSINIALKSLYASLRTANITAEIIVVDGSEIGNTLDVIDDNFKVFKVNSPKGRGLQMNRGANHSTGSHLLFLHADSILPKGAILSMLKAFENGFRVGSFDLQIETSSKTLKVFTFLAGIRSRVTRVPFGDQGHFIEKALFDQIGGYPQIPLMEDIEFMISIRERGMRITILFTPIITSGRRWRREGVFTGSIRNHLIRTAHRWGVSPYILSKFYSQGVDK